jgi:hypothetical protein
MNDGISSIKWLFGELRACQNRLEAEQARVDSLFKALRRYKAVGRNYVAAGAYSWVPVKRLKRLHLGRSYLIRRAWPGSPSLPCLAVWQKSGWLVQHGHLVEARYDLEVLCCDAAKEVKA